MLYSVVDVSKSIGLSKQSIYNKLKLKELEDHITKKQGITYIDEVGLNLIKDSLNDFKNETENNTSNDEITIDSEDSSLDKEFFILLKEQLKEKDKQIEDLNTRHAEEIEKWNARLAAEQELTKNMQVLQLKQKPPDIKALEEHFQDLDNRLINIRDQMQEKKIRQESKRSFLSKIFKK